MRILFKRKSAYIPWNKGKLVGQKPPLKLREIWAIPFMLSQQRCIRDLALFNLAIDSKLRACDLVKLHVSDVHDGSDVKSRSLILQKKTKRPVRFEISKHAREAIEDWVNFSKLNLHNWVFPSRTRKSDHISTRQYARIVKKWVAMIGLDPMRYGTHSLRRTKASLIYKQTKNLRAVQLLLGHTKLESTVRYLGIDVDDALEIAEQIDI